LRAAEPIPFRGGRRRNAQLIGRGLLWLLTPAVLLAAAGLALQYWDHWNSSRILLCAALALTALLLALCLWSQQRFWWAPRALGGMVALAYLGAVIRLSLLPGPGVPGPHLPLLFLASVGFMVCGVPALSFMLWGHTRGRLARGDAGVGTLMDRWTARLIPLLGHATWLAVGVYLLSLLVA
jgi:hypothetical protein